MEIGSEERRVGLEIWRGGMGEGRKKEVGGRE